MLEILSIGCLLSIVLCLRLSYWCRKFLQRGYPKYLEPFLKPRHSAYTSQAESVLLEVPHFAASVYKSSQYFGISFAYDAPKIWNDLPDDVFITAKMPARHQRDFLQKLMVLLLFIKFNILIFIVICRQKRKNLNAGQVPAIQPAYLT